MKKKQNQLKIIMEGKNDEIDYEAMKIVIENTKKILTKIYKAVNKTDKKPKFDIKIK